MGRIAWTEATVSVLDDLDEVALGDVDLPLSQVRHCPRRVGGVGGIALMDRTNAVGAGVEIDCEGDAGAQDLLISNCG